MSPGPHIVVGRPHVTARLAGASAGTLMKLVGGAAAVRGNTTGALFLLIGLGFLSQLWRKVTLHETCLVAQGRVSRRTVDLADITGSAVSPQAVVWVAPRHDRPFYLRMLAEGKGGTNPGIWEFPDVLRERAAGAGASLEPAGSEETSQPPEGIRPFFSW